MIVVIDDEEVREALDHALHRRGHDVLTYSSANEACDILIETGLEPDHLFIDYQLRQNLTALDALARLRSILPEVPITV